MSVVGSILMMLLMLSALTVVHEWGHYITARIFKVKVNEFSIFMGPKIYSHVSKKTGTVFSIRCIPIGGFCAMEGEESADESEDSFYRKRWYQRAVILVGGVFMNYVLAILLVIVLFATSGYSTRTVSAVSADMPMGMTDLAPGDRVVAYNGHGIATPNDYTLYLYVQETEDAEFTVRKQDGSKVRYRIERTFDRVENQGDTENPGTIRLTAQLYRIGGKNSEPELLGTHTAFWDNNRSLTIRQDFADGHSVEYFYGEEDGSLGLFIRETDASGATTVRRETDLSPDYTDAEYVQSMIYAYNANSMFRTFGFSFTYYDRAPGVLHCLREAFLYTFSLVKSVFLSLWWLITGRLGMDAMAGPIGITSLVNDVVTAPAGVSAKIQVLLDMTALISANLAVFNLLPVPGLDGGKLLFILIELIRGGKRVPPEKEGLISMIFFALLIVLALVVAGNDIVRLVKGP